MSDLESEDRKTTSRLKKNSGELIRYLIVGLLTTVVSLGVYYGLTMTVLSASDPLMLQLANVISWVAAVTFAYIASRVFVFKSRDEKVLSQAVKFYASRLATLGMDMAIMFLMVTILGADDKIAKIVVQVCVTVANYIISKLFVFGSKKEKAK